MQSDIFWIPEAPLKVNIIFDSFSKFAGEVAMEEGVDCILLASTSSWSQILFYS